jgi:hypothetical protein
MGQCHKKGWKDIFSGANMALGITIYEPVFFSSFFGDGRAQRE